MNRLNKILKQCDINNNNNNNSNKCNIRCNNVASYTNDTNDDDIVIVSGIRTAIGKAKRGSFASTSVTKLLAPVLKYVTKDIDPKMVDDIRIGNVLAPGGLRASECRMAQFIAGIPDTTTISTCNRQCSSGLQAIADIASSIKCGYIDVGIAGGVESMSIDKFGPGKNMKIGDDIKMNNDALNCLLPMGITSENVASKYGVTREEQDKLSVLSNQRAINAKLKYRQEILPITTQIKDKKSGKIKTITVIDDDGPRAGTNMKSLGKLRAVFKKGGTTTAGNSSQVSDGAAAVLMMKRSKAKELGLPIMGKFIGFAVSGVPPDVMGIGPAFAIPKVLKQTGYDIKDIDLFEINEAFASQAVYCVKKLGLTMDNVNVNGGAIAIGHPLGMTGARMTVTLLKEMERQGLKRGIVSMCIGSGMGAAAVFERE